MIFYEITIKNMTKKVQNTKKRLWENLVIMPLVEPFEMILNHQDRSFDGPFLL